MFGWRPQVWQDNQSLQQALLSLASLLLATSPRTSLEQGLMMALVLHLLQVLAAAVQSLLVPQVALLPQRQVLSLLRLQLLTLPEQQLLALAQMALMQSLPG